MFPSKQTEQFDHWETEDEPIFETLQEQAAEEIERSLHVCDGSLQLGGGRIYEEVYSHCQGPQHLEEAIFRHC